MSICICKNLAYFRLGKMAVNVAQTSTLFYLYAHKYCSSGDNQKRFFSNCCSKLVAIQIYSHKEAHKHIQLYNRDKSRANWSRSQTHKMIFVKSTHR